MFALALAQGCSGADAGTTIDVLCSWMLCKRTCVNKQGAQGAM